MGIAECDVVQDRGFQGAGTAVHAPPELFLGEQREPPFHDIDPRGADRREMQMEARPLRQPASDRGRLVGRVVVENEVDIQIRGDGGLDRIQESPEFHGAVPAVTLANDLARPRPLLRRPARPKPSYTPPGGPRLPVVVFDLVTLTLRFFQIHA
jgi:hypothetical protein